MRPPKRRITVLSSILLLRADARLLAARVGLEVLAATLLTLSRSVAGGWIERAPLALHTWTASATVVLSTLAAYFAIRVLARVGTIAVVFARARSVTPPRLLMAGSDGFADAVVGMLALLSLDAIAGGVLFLLFSLSARVAESHGVLGAGVAAVCIAAVTLTWLIAATYGTLAFVLGCIDGDGLFAAWPRVSRLIVNGDDEARGRLNTLMFFLGTLSIVVGACDFVSSLVSVAELGESSGLFMIVPILTLLYSMLIDVAAVVFLSSLTDRLPLGFATPITLVGKD